MERAGTQRWLVVKGEPEEIWPVVKDFWHELGFLIKLELPEAGVMETDWAENRAKIPEDIIRNTLGRLLDSMYSTSERDKFRTRMERGEGGTTEIYISHRGMDEVMEGNVRTVWQPRQARSRPGSRDAVAPDDAFRRGGGARKVGCRQHRHCAGARPPQGEGRRAVRERTVRPLMAARGPRARPYRLHRRGPQPLRKGSITCATSIRMSTPGWPELGCSPSSPSGGTMQATSRTNTASC